MITSSRIQSALKGIGATTLLLLASPVLAQSVSNTGSSDSSVSNTGTSALLNPLNVTSLPNLLSEILTYVQTLGGIALTIMLVYTGFLFVSARGNAEKLSQARSALLWTVVGGLLLLGASALATVITSTVSTL
ncbi:MAG: TrbC/VirB2 family protein [Candidatus Pacebacteria bacterium]|nr:TrbC/VirB2 family protein [Candidatus Paceibacterota bacterium]